jgi:hypothetical protein
MEPSTNCLWSTSENGIWEYQQPPDICNRSRLEAKHPRLEAALRAKAALRVQAEQSPRRSHLIPTES